MARRFAPTALLVGNFVIGTSVLAPAGMLTELAEAFAVSVRHASLLITFGALIMCVGSPLLSWSTSRLDRRLLLCGSLLVIAVSQLASAFADSFGKLLAARLVLLTAAAPFTPQAAGVVGMLVSSERRASTIAYVFLGWSLSTALGIPLVTSIASGLGWQRVHTAIAVVALASALLLAWRLPSGMRTPPVDLATWGKLARTPVVLRLLSLTVILTCGQFVLFTFIAPLLSILADAGPSTTGMVFSLFGIAGLLGNVLATRFVPSVGAYRTALAAVCAMAAGVTVWTLARGSLPLMVIAVGVWGLGFASSNSMQQARLVAADPPSAGASVALNTSAIYVGQALGSALGGALFARAAYGALGYAAIVCMLAGLWLLRSTRPNARAAPALE